MANKKDIDKQETNGGLFRGNSSEYLGTLVFKCSIGMEYIPGVERPSGLGRIFDWRKDDPNLAAETAATGSSEPTKAEPTGDSASDESETVDTERELSEPVATRDEKSAWRKPTRPRDDASPEAKEQPKLPQGVARKERMAELESAERIRVDELLTLEKELEKLDKERDGFRDKILPLKQQQQDLNQRRSEVDAQLEKLEQRIDEVGAHYRDLLETKKETELELFEVASELRQLQTVRVNSELELVDASGQPLNVPDNWHQLFVRYANEEVGDYTIDQVKAAAKAAAVLSRMKHYVLLVESPAVATLLECNGFKVGTYR